MKTLYIYINKANSLQGTRARMEEGLGQPGPSVQPVDPGILVVRLCVSLMWHMPMFV